MKYALIAIATLALASPAHAGGKGLSAQVGLNSGKGGIVGGLLGNGTTTAHVGVATGSGGVVGGLLGNTKANVNASVKGGLLGGLLGGGRHSCGCN